MNNKNLIVTTLATTLMLSACGGSDSEPQPEPTMTPTPTPAVTPTPDTSPSVDIDPVTVGPLSTGSFAAPATVYFDLESKQVLNLTDAEAKTNSDWDISFKRTDVSLNNNSEVPVSLYFTGNNSEFWHENSPVADLFLNATADSELADFTEVNSADIPTDDSAWLTDVSKNILEGFYHYNFQNHSVTANTEHYFIVNSDQQLTKFRVSALTQAGRYMEDITLAIDNQTADNLFTEIETTLLVDLKTECSLANMVYVDFSTATVVTADADWDLSFTCNDDNSATSFAMDIADDATALQDFDNAITGIPSTSIPYYDFKENSFDEKAFEQAPWYAYGIDGGIAHGIYSQFGVYLIKTANGIYKFQIFSYYDAEGNSGAYTFRVQNINP